MQINGSPPGSFALLFLSCMLAGPLPAPAQSAIGQVSGGPVLVHSVGIRDYAWQVGGSAEALRGPFALGGGIDYVYFPEVTKIFPDGGASSPAAGTIMLSTNGSFFFGDTAVARRTRPYVSGGVSFLVDGMLVPMLHFAGGVDWWATRRVGLRTEVRTQFPFMWTFRSGLVFR